MKRLKQLTPFGRKARKAMIDKGITIKELIAQLPNTKTKELGITRQYLNDIFIGKNDSPEQKQNIAGILGIKI